MAFVYKPVGGGAYGQYWVPDTSGGTNTPSPGFGNAPTGFYPATPAITTTGTLPGTPPQGGSGPYGAVPTVPDPTKSVGKFMEGWQSNLPAYTSLIKSINDEANRQAKANLETNLPGYTANLAQQSTNISDLLAGKISPSTINNIATAAAERGITVGGGPNANAAYLRALGLTTEGLQAQGAQQFAQQIASTPVGKNIDWATFASLANEQQQWEYLASVLRASPDPAAAGALNMLMAQLGQRTGYGASGGGAGRSPTPFFMPSTNTGSNPVQDIINKYMPQTGGGTTPAAPSTPGWGYAPGYGGATTGGTGEVQYEWTGTPTGTPTYTEEDVFQQNPAEIPQYWPETSPSGNIPATSYTPTYNAPSQSPATDWWGGVDYSLGPVTVNPSDVWSTITAPSRWAYGAVKDLSTVPGTIIDYLFGD